MTDKCEYEPVDTGEGKKKVNKMYLALLSKRGFFFRLRKWKRRQLV